MKCCCILVLEYCLVLFVCYKHYFASLLTCHDICLIITFILKENNRAPPPPPPPFLQVYFHTHREGVPDESSLKTNKGFFVKI